MTVQIRSRAKYRPGLNFQSCVLRVVFDMPLDIPYLLFRILRLVIASYSAFASGYEQRPDGQAKLREISAGHVVVTTCFDSIQCVQMIT